METNFTNELLEVGCDEAGRGCLAGPVFAGAVILDKDFDNQLVNDSKKISRKLRFELKTYIEEHSLDWSVAYVEPKKIDEFNILQASIMAMHLAIGQLKMLPSYIVVDGNQFKSYKNIPHTCIVRGDSKYRNIAAASILAKTYRDAYMEKLDEEFQMYHWSKNKGYPTFKHREAIANFGITIHHRKSFKLLQSQLEFNFK